MNRRKFLGSAFALAASGIWVPAIPPFQRTRFVPVAKKVIPGSGGGGTLKNNLISYWSLNNTLNDLHGSNNLTNKNSCPFGSGLVYANCLAPNGIVGYGHAYINDNAPLSIGVGQSFSVAAWFNLTTYGDWMPLVVKSVDSTTFEYRLSIDDADSKISFYTKDDGGTMSQAQLTSLSITGVWSFIVAWYDSVATKLNIQFNNGTVIQSSAGVNGATDGVGSFNVGDYIGNGEDGRVYNGLIGPVALWKRVLTSDERTQLYNSGNGLAYASF